MNFYEDITKYIAHHFINISYQDKIKFIKSTKDTLFFEYKNNINQLN